MCRRVMRSVASIYIYICVYVIRFASSRSKNPRKSAHEAFFLHLYFVNVTLDCQLTTDWALLLFLCSFLCAPRGRVGPGIVHTHVHWLVCVLLRLPQCWLDERATTTVCCWCLQYSKYSLTVLSMHRVCVLWNSIECHGEYMYILTTVRTCYVWRNRLYHSVQLKMASLLI